MRIFFLILSLFIFLISTSCIEELDVFQDSVDTFVVSGELTNVAGQQSVFLSYTTNYNTTIDYSRIRGAKVSVKDDLENEYIYKYKEFGEFVLEGFVGEVGRTYQLSILFEDGQQYYSLPEKMLPATEITSLNYERKGNGLEFSASFSDPPNISNYYRWRYTGTYEVFSPEAYALRDNDSITLNNRCYNWDVQPKFANVYSCWVTDYDREYLNVDSDFAFEGRFEPEKNIFTTPVDERFNYGYSLQVSQLSLTKNAFEYWNAIKKQIQNGGTIFETANYQIVGNLRSASNPSEVVLGYFSVAGVATKRIFINQFIGNFEEQLCETNISGCFLKRCVDCRAYPGNSKNIRPDFWPQTN